MKLQNKVFSVDLTEEEIEIITTALHGEYKFLRDELIPQKQKEDAPDIQRVMDKRNMTRDLRDCFSRLINRTYMGVDA